MYINNLVTCSMSASVLFSLPTFFFHSTWTQHFSNILHSNILSPFLPPFSLLNGHKQFSSMRYAWICHLLSSIFFSLSRLFFFFFPRPTCFILYTHIVFQSHAPSVIFHISRLFSLFRWILWFSDSRHVCLWCLSCMFWLFCPSSASF